MIYRNRKTKRKETPKPDPSKIQTGSKSTLKKVILPDSFSGAVLPENNNQHKRSEHRSPFLPVYARCLNATKIHASDSREPYMIPSDFP